MITEEIFLALSSKPIKEVETDMIFYGLEETKMLIDLSTVYRNSFLNEFTNSTGKFGEEFLINQLFKFDELIIVFTKHHDKLVKNNVEVFSHTLFDGPAFYLSLN